MLHLGMIWSSEKSILLGGVKTNNLTLSNSWQDTRGHLGPVGPPGIGLFSATFPGEGASPREFSRSVWKSQRYDSRYMFDGKSVKPMSLRAKMIVQKWNGQFQIWQSMVKLASSEIGDLELGVI